MGRPLSARACPPASSNLSPQLQLLSLLSASSTFTNFSIEETPQAGPDTVFLILLGASRPQPESIQRADQTGGGGLGLGAASGKGLREEVPARVGGAVPVQGLRPGVCRAPGRRLPATEGLKRSGGRETPKRTGSEVSGAGCPDRGLSGCTLHWATPAPSFQHFGVTGMGPSLGQPIS